MKVFPGLNVDLIEPFPLTEVHRLVGWLHCYKTIIHSDDSPQTTEALEEYFTNYFQQPNVRSWGLIDKHNKVNIQHEAPLVGFGAFEFVGSPATARNGYFHCATTRKAWGSGIIDEAAKIAFKAIFEEHPSLLRVSSFVINNNFPARKLAQKLGMRIEGVVHDAFLQGGIPKPCTHFGLTRRDWKTQQEEEKTHDELSDVTPGRVEPSEVVV